MYQNRTELLDLDYHSLKNYIYKLLRVESFTWFSFRPEPHRLLSGHDYVYGRKCMDHSVMFLCHKSRYINRIEFFSLTLHDLRIFKIIK